LAEIGLNEPDGTIAAALAASSAEFRRMLRDGAMRLDILRTSEDSIDQMDSVIRALRLFAHRSEEGKTSVVSLSGQIDAVLALNADRLRSGVGVIRDYGELPDYVCREEQLQQVWMNLVNNSLEAMGAAGPLIIVGSLDSAGPGFDLRHGAASPQRSRSGFSTPCSPPTTGDRHRSRLERGPGRGPLPGRESISFESVPGRTVFTVILRRRNPEPPRRWRPMSRRLVLCGDDELHTACPQDALRRELGPDIEVETAAGGEAALELLTELEREDREIAAVVSDWLMPGMGGEEFPAQAPGKASRPSADIAGPGMPTRPPSRPSAGRAGLPRCFRRLRFDLLAAAVRGEA
jgi:hypothetical protein